MMIENDYTAPRIYNNYRCYCINSLLIMDVALLSVLPLLLVNALLWRQSLYIYTCSYNIHVCVIVSFQCFLWLYNSVIPISVLYYKHCNISWRVPALILHASSGCIHCALVCFRRAYIESWWCVHNELQEQIQEIKFTTLVRLWNRAAQNVLETRPLPCPFNWTV